MDHPVAESGRQRVAPHRLHGEQIVLTQAAAKGGHVRHHAPAKRPAIEVARAVDGNRLIGLG
jgi:hypothetical protein